MRVPSTGNRQASCAGVYSIDRPGDCAGLARNFLWSSRGCEAKRRLRGVVVDRQDALCPVAVRGMNVIEAGGLRTLSDLRATGLGGHRPRRSFGLTIRRDDRLKSTGVMHSQNVLTLRETCTIYSLILVHFTAGVATMPPVAKEKLCVAGRGNQPKIPVDPSRRVCIPLCSSESELLKPV